MSLGMYLYICVLPLLAGCMLLYIHSAWGFRVARFDLQGDYQSLYFVERAKVRASRLFYYTMRWRLINVMMRNTE